ncbi:MAG: DAK2 domain-containing protein [Bacillales bacterium]|nr:DAK2 domain-containing protein [Bacillales bacterium]
MQDKITAKLFKDMMLNGVNNLSNNVKEINELNVFPVPDGDTGTNMRTTLAGGVSSISQVDSFCDMCSIFARNCLLSARGNSGVILSQFFNGLAFVLKNFDCLDVNNIYAAFESGVEYAYNSVVSPKEGTILTCFRIPLEKVKNNYSSLDEFFSIYIQELKIVIPQTKMMLPVLLEADVVDSGGKGWLYIIEGMYEAFKGVTIESNTDLDHIDKNGEVNNKQISLEDGINYGYCTEFIVFLAKNNLSSFDKEKFIKKLEEMGDSIVCIKDDSLVKVHIHTKEPGDVINFAHKYGEFISLKIENMSLQNQEVKKKNKKAKKHKKNAIISISTGDGFETIFNDLNVDVIINGGQTMNTSCQEIMDAFELVDADNIFVLPNNKNILLAALQAKELTKDKNVIVIDTKTLVEGYFALSCMTDPNGEEKQITQELIEGKQAVLSCKITKAIRDSSINELTIKEGEYIGFCDENLVVNNTNSLECLISLLGKIDDLESHSIVIFVGQEEKYELEEIESTIYDNYPNVEIGLIYGGQDVYHYLIGVI